MKKGEFNNLTSTKRKGTRSNEFSNGVDGRETSSFPGNSDRPKYEFNPGDTTNEALGNGSRNRASSSSQEDFYKNQQSSESVQGAAESATAEVASSASSAAATAGTVTSSIAVAVSTVSIVAVSTLVGINTISASNASVEFSRFAIYDREVFYALNLRDYDEESNDPFSIKIENSSYSVIQELFPGQNEGVFEGLVPEETYTVSVLQDRLGGLTIYEESFSMVSNIKEETGAEFYWVYLNPEANFEDGTFEITLEYFDEDNRFSDFALIISGKDINDQIFPLEATKEVQTVSFDTEILFPDEVYTFTVTYLDQGRQNIYEGGQFSFIDHGSFETNSHFYNFDFNAEAGVEDYQPYFYVTLDYEDPDEVFSDFTLMLTSSDGTRMNYSLEKTTETQKIYFNGDNEEFLKSYYNDFTCNYTFTYYDASQPELNPSTSGEVTFTFVYLEAYFYFSANYSTGESTIELFYNDPNNVIDTIQLVIWPIDAQESEAVVINLEKSPEAQAVFLSDLELDESVYYNAKVTYIKSGETYEIDLGSSLIENTLVSYFESFTVETEFDKLNRTYSVGMTYTDENDYFSDFELVMTAEWDSSISFTQALEKTATTQTFSFPESLELDESGMTFAYQLSYADSREANRLVVEGSVTLVDSDYVKQDVTFSSITFDKTMNFVKGTLDVAVSYTDVDNRLSSMTFNLTDADDNSNYSADMDLTTETQTLTFRDLVVNELQWNTFTYWIGYTYDEGENSDSYQPDSESFTFTNNGTTTYNGVESPYYLTADDYLYLRLDIEDDAQKYSDPAIEILSADGTKTLLEKTYLGQSGEGLSDWNYVYVADCDLQVGETYALNVYASDYSDSSGDGSEDPTVQLNSELITFTVQDGSSISAISGIRLNDTLIETANPTLSITPYFTITEGLSDFQLTFQFGDLTDMTYIPYTIDEDFPSHGNYFSIDLSTVLSSDELTTFLEKMNSETVTVGFQYVDADGETQSRIEYEDIFFIVS